jgi:hypothetical protein
MKTTVFDAAVATEVENLVMAVFKCQRHDIVQFIDSDVKKAVVFVLYYHLAYNKRVIGWNYKMTHWYVPAACEEIKVICEHDSGFKSKIDFVLTNTIDYVRKEVMVA